MNLFERGDVWWYEFWFAGRRIRETRRLAALTKWDLPKQECLGLVKLAGRHLRVAHLLELLLNQGSYS
jgi:hypothetical protein